MNVLAVIPARAGSQRVPDKNLKKLGGKTLVQLAYECAELSGIFSEIVVSTNDPAIAGSLPFVRRPDAISGPTADISDAVSHAMKAVETEKNIQFDYVVTLQPAIPIRKPGLIQSLLNRVISNDCGGGVTGVEVVPWLWSAEDGHASNGWYPNPYPRSQEFANKSLWQEINSVQVASRAAVLNGDRWRLPLAIELLPPFAVLDIDTPADFELAERVYDQLIDAYSKDTHYRGFVVHKIN